MQQYLSTADCARPMVRSCPGSVADLQHLQTKHELVLAARQMLSKVPALMCHLFVGLFSLAGGLATSRML